MSPSGKQGFVISGSPPSQLQVAGAAGHFIQTQGEGMIQVSSPTHMDGMVSVFPHAQLIYAGFCSILPIVLFNFIAMCLVPFHHTACFVFFVDAFMNS